MYSFFIFINVKFLEHPSQCYLHLIFKIDHCFTIMSCDGIVYYLIFKTIGATSGAGTAYPSVAPEFTPGF